MITLANIAKCSGCAACEQICPAGALKMKENQEGFLFPEINKDVCVSCKKCEKVCPVNNPLSKKEVLAVYAARAKDEDVVSISSSGGLFGTLAKSVLEKGGIVFGAGFDSNLKLIHKSVHNLNSLSVLMGSKYVQSDIMNSYKEAKVEAEKGRQVIFAGTPCQCAGLVKFIGKDYPNLLVVDFACHGVPSPLLFEKYLKFMSAEKEIDRVRFRDKTENKKTGLQISVTYKDGSVYRKNFTEDPYTLAFLENLTLRESCHNCSFKNFTSGSDITIGDFWGLEKTDSPLKEKDGVSLLILNTEKGRSAFENISAQIESDLRTIEEAVKENKALVTSTRKNPLRNKYLKGMHKNTIDKLKGKYCGNSFGVKLKRLIAGR